ncbi:MAG: bifunctional phosphoserine phosphatase/homoserine phosphotransferase ThrH [Nitrospirales bacterium]|nr:bifunctional phosphoserine phosphatase/homoserine phosphotransferase ThrH [Nitrospirales bacterium]
MEKPVLVCLDMEGVLVPEIWIAVAEKIGVQELLVTTREIPDYDELMQRRLKILNQQKITLSDIEHVVSELRPLEGATEFLHWLRARCQVIILSDTFYELAGPLIQQLGYPTIFSHTLEVNECGAIRNYHLRQADQKRHAVAALKSLHFRVLAAGDSYNDISMLQEAHAGIFFRPPESICEQFPQFPVTVTYAELKAQLREAGAFSAHGG